MLLRFMEINNPGCDLSQIQDSSVQWVKRNISAPKSSFYLLYHYCHISLKYLLVRKYLLIYIKTFSIKQSMKTIKTHFRFIT